MSTASQAPFELIRELDKLKGVYRAAYAEGGARHENSAEHSWHVAMTALLLSKYATKPLDILKVVTMLLVHDIVEIDAGDAVLFDEEARMRKQAAEHDAAQRLFALTRCQDTTATLHELRNEFEAKQSDEALFAQAMDRLLPIILNFNCEGRSWQDHKVSRTQVLEKSAVIAEASVELWELCKALLEEAVNSGWLRDQ